MDGNRLKKSIRKIGMTEDAFAGLVGVSRTHLINLIAERKNPSYELACKIADVIGLTVDELRKKRKGGKNESGRNARWKRSSVRGSTGGSAAGD